MKTLILLSLLRAIFSQVVFANCPAPGDEPVLDSVARAARNAYLQDSLIDGGRQTLVKENFCPFETELAIDERDCDEEGNCVTRYQITEWFEHLNSEQRLVTAKAVVKHFINQPKPGVLVQGEDFGLEGLYRMTDLDEGSSELFASAMHLAGVPRDMQNLDTYLVTASSLSCYRATFPRAPTTCVFKILDHDYSLASVEANVALHDTLVAFGAATGGNDGAVKGYAAIISCSREHAPNSPTKCGLFLSQ